MPEHDAEQEKLYAAESGVAGIRVLIIALNSLVYLFLMDRSTTIAWLADAIVVLALVYGFGVYLLRPYRRYPLLLSAYWTSGLDAVFITAWLLATGGVGSPFHPLWLVSVTAVAFRFGPRETFFAATLYAASYLALVFALGQASGNAVLLVVRVAYIFFTAAIGALLSREVNSQARARKDASRMAAQLQESEERLRRLSDATFEGIVIHEHGRFIECNRAMAEMFGYDRTDELIGKSPLDIIDTASHATIVDRLKHVSDAPYEVVGLRRDGSTFDIEIAARDIPLQGKLVRVVAIRDITERKRAQRATKEREALVTANERLQEMDNLKSRFINNAAHELGTPLTPIKLQAHLLKLGSLGDLSEKQRKAVDVLERNVDHLGLMVKDLLDASRIQSQELRLRREPTDVSKVLSEAVESFQGSDARGVEVRVEAEPHLVAEADAARLTQVVFNLVNNALKFTPSGGRVDVAAGRTKEGEIVVSVRDTGAGIDPKELPRLFQPFSQLHDVNARSRSGTGLGLYISRGIVEGHGGRIWASSDGKGKGTTMWFTIPTKAA